MFIRVKYGDNETLLCNPSCAAVNLLMSIKQRTGFDDKMTALDLSDEKGLVQELETRKYDQASSILAAQSTYILVQKQAISPSPDHDPGIPAADSQDEKSIQYEYIPLLNNCLELFPDYNIQVQSKEGAQKRSRRPMRGKATSPAGLKVAKGDRKNLSKRR